MHTKVAQKLIDSTHDENPEIVLAAIYALGEGGSRSNTIASRLLELTDDPRLDIKIAALRALGRASINRFQVRPL